MFSWYFIALWNLLLHYQVELESCEDDWNMWTATLLSCSVDVFPRFIKMATVNECERAIQKYNDFSIGEFKLRVKFSKTAEEDRNRQGRGKLVNTNLSKYLLLNFENLQRFF
jgi:hypothetical protein